MEIRNYLWITWVILAVYGHFVDAVYRGKCQSEGYFEAVRNNSRLKGYVISTQDVYSLEDCVMACLSDEHCSSYNFEVSGNPLHKCELNVKSRSSARPGSLVLAEGYKYYEIRESTETQAPCETFGCRNAGTCVENCKTLSFPHQNCQCTSLFMGAFCDLPKTGNFLLNYNASAADDHVSVSVTGDDFNYLAACVWVKPRVKAGVVFSYATESNTREMALFFNETNVFLHLGGYVAPFKIKLPVNKWSHICFILYSKVMLDFYHNGIFHTTVKMTGTTIIKGAGTLVPAFEQISPGNVDKTSNPNLTVTRLQVLDKSELADYEILRLFNEPYFSYLTRQFRVDWREFYRDTPALVFPSVEPELGNYDLRLPSNANITIDVPYIPPLDNFVLSMWIKVNKSGSKDASVFELYSGTKTVVQIRQRIVDKGFEVFLNWSNASAALNFANLVTDERWFNLLFQWKRMDAKLYQYKDGSHMNGRYAHELNVTIPEIHNGLIKIGDGVFVGDITAFNMWSSVFTTNMIIILALNPGNAVGDLFSWESLREKGYLGKHEAIAPSGCHQRSGQFDLIFPKQTANNLQSYILMNSTYKSSFHAITAAFWIKIPPEATDFTLISLAVLSEVNTFNVHFGSDGIWVYIHGSQTFIELRRSKLINEWHHFVIFYASRTGLFFCYHNGDKILKTDILKQNFKAQDRILVIGAQQSAYNQVHQTEFRFTGEISQLQIYRKGFSQGAIRTFAARCSSIPGNNFRWADMPVGIVGHVRMRNSSECFKAKNGENG